MAALSPEVVRLLMDSPQRLPLVQRALDSVALGDNIPSLDGADHLFPGARQPRAALAGLLLRMGCWPESHSVAQDVLSPEGSYWHGVLHRMEPDPANAAYWFRRLGNHPVFPDLLSGAKEMLARGGPPHWRVQAAWDPLRFIEWCTEASATGGRAEETAIEIQMLEWQLLFDWCAAGK